MDDTFDDILAQIPEVDGPPPEKQTKIETPSTTESSQTTEAVNESQKISNNKTSVEAITIKKVGSSSFSILVNPKQKGNPLLSSITSIPWEFAEVIPDYVMGATTCALFLSVRYHNMNPDYIQDRLKELGKSYTLRVLLVLVDVPDPHLALKNLTRICLLADLTLMLAFNSEDAGKIIETYKIYENKPADRIMERVENDPHQKLISALTSIKPVNKTDAQTLLTNFGTVEKIIKATETQLSNCPGFGPRKASKLYKVLHEPFLKKSVSSTYHKKDEYSEDLNIEEIEALIDG